MDSKTEKLDYKSAGVDVEAGDRLVDWLIEDDKNFPTAHFEKVVSGIGGFASLFRADFSHLKKPCLVTCTDGVGTKVKIAADFGRFEGIGQDLVAMCVNDLICTGGEPLLFLDYYASGKLNVPFAQSFLRSVRKACFDSDCALIGGETAEMPGVYQGDDFDCAGFAVGVVDEERALGARLVKKGDRVLGVSSSGFHSNGYSLLRQVFAQELAQKGDSNKWLEALLVPTALYVKLFKKLHSQVELHALAHITGGGTDNVPRVLPDSLTWKMKSWTLPEPFQEVQRRTGLSLEKLRVTLNCGVGLVVILPAAEASQAQALIESEGFSVFDLGEIS